MDASFFAFASFALVFAITPGATTALVIRNTLAGGRTAGLVTAGGAAAANVTYALATVLGLTLLVSRWPLAVDGIRLCGALYLAWLGGVSISRAIREPDGGLASFVLNDDAAVPGSRRQAFVEGLTLNLLNPAIASFYLSVVPSFVPTGAPRSRFALLAATHVAMAFACHALWVVALGRVRPWLSRPWRRRALQFVIGAALVGLAIRLLWSTAH